MKRYLEAGQIVRSHGVQGEMSLEPWADSPEFLKQAKHLYFDEEGKEDAGLCGARVHKGRLLIKLKDVTTVEQADVLRNKVLYLDREEVRLKDGQFFLQDLIGLSVVDDKTGRVYGTLTQVLPTGANDVYRIVNEEGKEFLFPAVKHMIAETNPQEGVMKVLPIPGIFDSDGEEA